MSDVGNGWIKCPKPNCDFVCCTEEDMWFHLEFGMHTYERKRYQEPKPEVKPKKQKKPKPKIYRYF